MNKKFRLRKQLGYRKLEHVVHRSSSRSAASTSESEPSEAPKKQNADRKVIEINEQGKLG